MFKKALFLLFLAVFIFSAREVFSFDESQVCGLKEVGVFTGWAQGKLKDDQPRYEMVLLGGRFGWNIKPWLKFVDFPSSSLFEFVLEPYLNPVTSPHSNVEIGTQGFFKYAHPLITNKLLIYLEVGTGMQYGSQHVYEQGTQFNFASSGGGGFYYFLKDNLALNVGYRIRHMSNLGIKDPNSGVNTQHYMVGISWMY